MGEHSIQASDKLDDKNKFILHVLKDVKRWN
jgi:hypothetical protein